MKKTNKNIFTVPAFVFKKRHKHFIRAQNYNSRQVFLSDATFGVKALECAKVTHKQTETFRRILVRKFKKHITKFWYNLQPDWPVSQKSRGTRMGKGKGAIGYWVNRISSGKVGLYIALPAVAEPIHFYKTIYKSMCKTINFKNKLISNSHILQEFYNNRNVALNYWKTEINILR